MEIGSSSVRPERKIVERNRRIRLKILYSQLYALLPQPPLATQGRGSVQVPDQLDASVKYIKWMQESIESMKERKKHLLTELESSQSEMKLPLKIEVHDLGIVLQAIIISNSNDWFVFIKALRVVEDEGGEIVDANFSVAGDKAFHVINFKVGEPKSGQEASSLLEKLKDIHLFSSGFSLTENGTSFIVL